LGAASEAFGIPAERFALVRFPARTVASDAPAPVPRENGPVVAAGRAHCDWPTLFAAAARRGWDLQVVCSAADRALVEQLNAEHHASAQISVELTQPEAHALLSHAAISVICVKEGLVGRGHIRLAEATDTGAAIVASDVVSLRGYVENVNTALLVPVGDSGALRAAIERLVRDPAERTLLATNAFTAAGSWTGQDYVAALQALASEAVSRPPAD
jgi:glycosyltransferase involved in cell wall biosynthesis